MDFKTSQKLYSVPRMRKYQNACAGDKRKTMQLYRYNLRLCQRFYVSAKKRINSFVFRPIFRNFAPLKDKERNL